MPLPRRQYFCLDETSLHIPVAPHPPSDQRVPLGLLHRHGARYARIRTSTIKFDLQVDKPLLVRMGLSTSEMRYLWYVILASISRMESPSKHMEITPQAPADTPKMALARGTRAFSHLRTNTD